jgi:hypothetical protein
MVRAAVNALSNDQERVAPAALEIHLTEIAGRLQVLARELKKVIAADHPKPSKVTNP